MAVAVWAILPPYVGPALATDTRVEIADHVLPAVVVLLLSIGAIVRHRQRASGFYPLVAGLGVLLAGIWMTATHIPLVAQAVRHEVGSGAAGYHTLPGLAVTVLGIVWVGVNWGVG